MMMKFITALLAAVCAAPALGADSPAPVPDARSLVAAHTRTFSFDENGLTGPGADFLRVATAGSQFVLIGEQHMDHLIPIFSGALYRTLHSAHRFRHLVVEQDPIAIEDALDPMRRGNVDLIAEWAKRYPTLYEFDSDEDLAFLARVGALENRADAIWGVEQTTGVTRYFDELQTLASNPTVRANIATLRKSAASKDPGPKYSVNWLASADSPAEIDTLTRMMEAKPGSRVARLLHGMARSSEIFGYYRRAQSGEFVGLYNNTVREEVLKANFLDRYRRVARDGHLPKAMFKFGSNHMYRGKNPTQAFPIGNLVHELAIANGLEAYGIVVYAFGPGYGGMADLPAWLRPLLPEVEPTQPTIIDLRALRPYQRLFRDPVAPADLWEQRALLHGYDAIVLIPGSRPATKIFAGRTGY